MTGAQMLDLLMYRLGHRSNSTLRTAAALEAQLAQQLLEGGPSKPWFLWSQYTDAGFATAANVATVAVPSGYLSLDDDAPGLAFLDSTATTPDQWVELARQGLDDLVQDAKANVAGPPERYDIRGFNIYLRPFPDAVYTLRLGAYFADAPVMDTSASNLWTTWASDVLLAQTLIVVAGQHLGDDGRVQQAAADLQKAQARLAVENTARMMAARQLTMGD